MSISEMDFIKTLRERTGAGILECKKAYSEAKGDLNKAIEILRERGLALAVKKAGRVTTEGLIFSYIHAGGKLGVLLELSCETDFVANTDDFKNLGKEIAMQIAASDPLYINTESVPQEVIEKEKSIYKVQLEEEKKPANVIEKIIEGKLKAFYKQACLLEQAYLRDESKVISDLIKEIIAKTGENISVKRFARFKIGEAI